MFLFSNTGRRDQNGNVAKINCQEHPGPYPFSEIETRALRQFISAAGDNCKLFVAVKQGAKVLKL